MTSLKSVCVGGLFCVTRTAPRLKLIVNAYLLNMGSNRCIVVFRKALYRELVMASRFSLTLLHGHSQGDWREERKLGRIEKF